MAETIISKKTLYEFQEYLSACSIVRKIQILFDSADILCDEDYQPNLSGTRRILVAQYYHTLDLTRWEDARKLICVFEEVLSQLETTITEPNTFSSPNTDYHRKYLDRLSRPHNRGGSCQRDRPRQLRR